VYSWNYQLAFVLFSHTERCIFGVGLFSKFGLKRFLDLKSVVYVDCNGGFKFTAHDVLWFGI